MKNLTLIILTIAGLLILILNINKINLSEKSDKQVI